MPKRDRSAYYLANKEQIKERNALYAANNTERARGYRKTWNSKNPEKVREAARRYRSTHPYHVNKAQRQIRYELGRAHIKAYLGLHPCVDCGETDVDLLEFDHVRGEKLNELSRMAAHAISTIDAEIAKCEVRCANCHRKVTRQRQRSGR